MDLSAINPNAPRPYAAQPDDRLTPLSAVPETSAPLSAQAVRQSAEAQAVGDRPSQPAPGQLTDEEQAVVQKLKARDREVRAHEQAHKTVGGQYAGAISYDYQRGPDGQNYAIGGSVPIDVSTEPTPEETIAKMEVVIRAALAPAEPSSADRSVAANAQAKLADAQFELSAQRAAERRGEDPEAGNAAGLAAYRAAEQEPSDPFIALQV